MTIQLEQLTQVYWGVSHCFNGRSATTITTGDAIAKVNTVLFNTGPQRKRLRNAGTQLMDELIHRRRCKKPKQPPDNILRMVK